MKQNGKYRLTNQQNNIYLLDSIYKDSGINNIGSWLEIDDNIDVKLMQKVANIIVQKNDCYRLRFNLEGNEPYQYVEEYKEFDVDVLYVKDEYELEKKIKLVRFDLKKDLPFKFCVFKYPNGKGGFVAIVHHLAGDAWTMNLIILQIITFYYNLKNNIQIDDTPYPSYLEYVLSQEEFLKSEKISKNQRFWEEIFKEPIDILSFKSRANVGIESERKEFKIDKDLLGEVRKFCKHNDISEYVFLLSVYSIYFGRIKKLNKYVIGNPILNRANAKEKKTSGLFMSINPFVVEIDENISFLTFAKKIQQDQMNMYRHLKYDYKQLVRYINEKNNTYENIYDVVFSYQNAKVSKQENNFETRSRWVENNKQVESLMIHLKDTDDTGEILFAYDYLTQVFSKDDIIRMHKRIEHIISLVLENRFIKYIDIVPTEEKEKLLVEYNDTYYEYSKNETIVSAIEKICDEKYDKTALIFEDEKISYGQMNKKANQLARVLKNIGVQSGDIVAVVDSRSIDMIIAMLAILKVGAAYVPIDIEYPKERIEYIIKNANCKVCITRKEYKHRFSTKGKRIFSDDEMIYTMLSENLYSYIPSSNLAYMIYTSGSTGNPKGVMITHKNVINFIEGTTSEINFKNKTVVSVTTISFDIFVLESWLALSRGCTVVIANEEQQNIPVCLNQLCVKYKVNMIQTTPSRMRVLMSDKENSKFLSNMSDIMLGGEAVPYQIVQQLRLITKANLYNMYGPTETTVWSTIKKVTKEKKITIGKPIANTQIYIFDDNMNLCPINVEGNIYIGGDGLSDGYYRNSDLTNEKFIHNPLVKNQYIYDTGDIGKWNEDGNLECLGRSDFQVKLHGHRIELEEIENTILRFEGIKESSVVCLSNKSLYAYFTCKDKIDKEQLKKFVQEKLPTYMIPSKFIQIDSMPRTPNGKTDKKALLKVNIKEEIQQDNIIEPKTDIEKTVCIFVSDILNINCNNVNENLLGLGMDSLNIIDLCNRIIKKYEVNITVKDIFTLQTINSVSDKIEKLLGKQVNINIQDITNRINDNISEATIGQSRIYFASQMQKESILYNMPYAIILQGALDINKFKYAVNEVVKSHVVFKLSFEISSNVLYQRINDIDNLVIEVEKIKQEEVESKYINFVRAFDLSVAPLMRIKILQINKNYNIILFDMHHIISDGTSLHILANEISQIYNGQEVIKTDVSYIDFAQYQNGMLKQDCFIKEKNYWVNEFNDYLKPLDMPYDYKDKENDLYKGQKLHYTIEENMYKDILKLAKANSVTPNIVLLSIYYILLSRYTQNTDIVIGMPFSNRDNINIQNSIGLYVNELPVRMQINEKSTFVELLHNVKNKMINVLDNSNYPNGKILQMLKKNGINVGNRLFDTMFIFQNNGMPILNLNNIQSTPYLLDNNISKYNFSMEIVNENNSYEVNLEYATELFKKETIESFLLHYINILDEVMLNPEILIENIQMISEQEKNHLLYEVNDTLYEFNENETIQSMISKKCIDIPNEIALVFENNKLTYLQLEEMTNALAMKLRKRGINRNDIVGIMTKRSFEMIIGIIGILKAGASYMPIDISYPKDRIDYMLKSSNAKLVLVCDDNLVENQKYINISLDKKDIYLNKDETVKNENVGDDVAYVIYTSGSTGNPKGVLVKHKSISNLVHYANNNVEFLRDGIKRNIVSITTMSFDIFVFETLIALQRGLTIVIANEDEQRIPSKLHDLIMSNNIEIIQTTPSRMEMLIEYIKDIPSLKKVKYVVLAGEQYKQELFENIKKIIPNVVSYNGYGPSETTIFSTLTLVNSQSKINIGKPLYNTTMYVFDKQRRLLPHNHVGELYIGGVGVSKGYLNNNMLTNERFIQNPYVKEEMIYQTGDLVKLLDNGEFECLGRTDSQVKIRGLRIELEEIESAIIKTGLIDNVVVVDKVDNNNRQYLSAYFIANNKVDIQEIRNKIAQYLPSYMIPTHFEQIEKFNYTPNGKIDKKLFKNKIDKSVNNKDNTIMPQNKLQKELLDMYKKILNRNDIGISDDFFAMGGDSILAMKLQIQLINNKYDVSYGDIFKYSTVKQLEQRLNKNINKETMDINIKNYDMILNNCIDDVRIKKQKVKSVMLIGATGFVGIHILANLLDRRIKKIYCLVRDKDNKLGIERLKDKLHFYFSTKYDKYIGNRIIVVNSNVIDEKLGIDKEIYENITNDVDVVINALAKVSHYGKEEDFYNVNVNSVKNIVQFCNRYNKKLFHISTISVSGNALADQMYISNDIKGEVVFKESNLYINQPLDNLYIKTKFLAEQIIFDNIQNGLDGYILRLGNIMGRYKDGHFQENANDNAYINRLKAIYNLGVIPEYIKDGYLEFTPVDYLAKAIVKIVFYNNNINRVFHLFNNNHIDIVRFIEIFESLYKRIEIVDEKTFEQKLNLMLKKDNYSISFILNDLNKNKKLQYKSNIKVDAGFTNRYLRKIGFKWPQIDKKYIKKFFDYLFGIDFFRKE